MGDALYRFFLSIGVGLGLVAAQIDPTIVATVLRQEGRAPGQGTLLVAVVRVEQAFSAGSRELVESGSTVALRVKARLVARDGEAWESSATRLLAWNPTNRRYSVGVAGEQRMLTFSDPEAALDLASSLPDLVVCPAANLAGGGRVTIAATIGLLDGAGGWHEAPVLWNYVKPEVSFAFASPTEVPY